MKTLCDLPARDGEQKTLEPNDFLQGLNPEQAAAVLHRGSPLLIVAGAGSGKTRVLSHRIAHLMAQDHIRSGAILAITFTNKAAAEMRHRIAELVGENFRHMWIATFHSACVRILRREAKTLGFNGSFSIYDSADSLRAVTLIMKNLAIDPKRFAPKSVQHKISSLKNELVDDESFAATARGPFDETVAEVYREYAERLRQANALDFDDLIAQTVWMFRAFPHVADYYRSRFRHVLVDEYQDTNAAQYAFIRELTEQRSEGTQGSELTVVGDSDQSIYAFRGADRRNIIEFAVDYPEAQTIKLEQNYRSTQNILSAANAVIERNPGRSEKRLWTASGDGEKLVGYVAEHERDEAEFVADEIFRLGKEEGLSGGKIAVFYRANAQSRSFEEVFLRRGLPYRVVGGTRFYDRKEIKDVIAYLRILVNPQDDVSARRIFNEPKRGLGDKAESAVGALASQEKISFLEALLRIAHSESEAPGLPSRSRKALGVFAELVQNLQDLAEASSPSGVLEATLEHTGYVEALRASADPQDESRLENIAELMTVVREFEEDFFEGTLRDFLENIALVADGDGRDAERAEAGGEVVTLMTLHSAKGLEFPVVFLTGLEYGVFPHARATENETELAEERRLAYVGLTRARQRLYLTRSEVRSLWGQSQYNPVSPFLSEIPAALIDWQYGSGVAPEGAMRSSMAWSTTVPPRRPRRVMERHDIPEFQAGDRVRHTSFGLGTVAALEGQEDKRIAKVRFDDEEKRLLLRYAPLTKVEGE